MKTIDWKDTYISYDGDNVAPMAKYVSISGSTVSGNGTREKPYNPVKGLVQPSGSTHLHIIMGNGKTALFLNTPNATQQGTPSIIGQSKENTIITSISNWSGAYARLLRLKDLRVENLKSPYILVRNCIVSNITLADGQYDSGASITNSIFYGRPVVIKFGETVMTNQCTFVRSPILSTIFKSLTPLLVESEVYIEQATLDRYSNYMAFNNCKFIIGAETTSTELVGKDSNELRDDFVRRCVAQGLTVPTVNEYGDEISVGRWIFSNTSILGDYDTLQNSEIDLFAKIRGIYFGHTNQMINQIPITTTLNTPASFNTQTPVKEARVIQNSIGLLASSDISKRIEGYADSKIIWLGGLRKLDTLSLVHNLPIDAGIFPNSVYGLDKNKTINGNILANAHYVIRSNNNEMASIKYNNIEYTSSLITRNNVFVGESDIATFEDLTGNSEIYQVLNFANQPSIQIRLVREIPAGNITSGNLQPDYWYFVEPNNLSDTSGTVTYKGVSRPAFDSFLADASNLTFTVNGTCHLRRCWKQDFDYESETIDKSFWASRQKPSYYDVIPDDLRCLLKNNSAASQELETDENGGYIGSGHPSFYNSVNGINGRRLPANDIIGCFLQMRIPITTLNPM